jgi:hypothetical protein
MGLTLVANRKIVILRDVPAGRLCYAVIGNEGSYTGCGVARSAEMASRVIVASLALLIMLALVLASAAAGYPLVSASALP